MSGANSCARGFSSWAGPWRRCFSFPGSEVTDLTDGQRAAALWLLNSFLCRSLQTRPNSHTLFLVLNGEDLISRPEHTVLAAAEFFGLADNEASRTALEMLAPSSRHSKERRPYDATARAADLAAAEAQHGGEVQAALSWASAVSSGWIAESPFPVA